MEAFFSGDDHTARPDVSVWLTRRPLGGPSGYAPVSGACDPARATSLIREEGLSSSFIVAHELGHIFGLSHDGDASAGNECAVEAAEGSVMAPMVGATFSSFHWSRCSSKEYHEQEASWRCMRNYPTGEPFFIGSNIEHTGYR